MNTYKKIILAGFCSFAITAGAHDFSQSPDFCESGTIDVYNHDPMDVDTINMVYDVQGVFCEVDFTASSFHPRSSNRMVKEYIEDFFLRDNGTHGIIDQLAPFSASRMVTAYTYCQCAKFTGLPEVDPSQLRTQLLSGGYEESGHESDTNLYFDPQPIRYACHVCVTNTK